MGGRRAAVVTHVCCDLPSEIKAGLVWVSAVCTAHRDALES